MGTLSVSFLTDAEDEIIHLNQIDPNIDLQIKNNSALSITIANLHLYLTENCDWARHMQKMEQCIGDNLGSGVHSSIVPEDNKIPLTAKFLPLLEQLFFAMNLDYRDVRSLISELEEFFNGNDCEVSKAHHLLILPAFKRVFADENGFFTKQWQIFTKNVTCQDTGAVALRGLSDELLKAVCMLENWRLDDARPVLQNAPFANLDIFTELHSRGCAIHNFEFFRNRSCWFNLTITAEVGDVRLVKIYTVGYNPLRNWFGLPFEVVPST
ncbi:MAG: hypothetical protein LBD33_00785 [Puniceicoccales bacterium]|nr:hypothetical protein [Puniceicoccales bacterium]